MGWPAAMVFVALIGALTVLGVTHVLEAAWLEHTATALIGLAVGGLGGHAIGSRRATQGE